MSNETTKLTVKVSKVYVERNGHTINTYVDLDGERLFVNAQEGDEVSKSQAKRLATFAPVPVAETPPITAEPKPADEK